MAQEERRQLHGRVVRQAVTAVALAPQDGVVVHGAVGTNAVVVPDGATRVVRSAVVHEHHQPVRRGISRAEQIRVGEPLGRPGLPAHQRPRWGLGRGQPCRRHDEVAPQALADVRVLVAESELALAAQLLLPASDGGGPADERHLLFTGDSREQGQRGTLRDAPSPRRQLVPHVATVDLHPEGHVVCVVAGGGWQAQRHGQPARGVGPCRRKKSAAAAGSVHPSARAAASVAGETRSGAPSSIGSWPLLT